MYVYFTMTTQAEIAINAKIEFQKNLISDSRYNKYAVRMAISVKNSLVMW